jgi:hypothetical protein
MAYTRIRFTDSHVETEALGFLTGRFSFTSWESGETLVPEAALKALTNAGFSYTIVGPPTYGQTIPQALRTPASDPVQ